MHIIFFEFVCLITFGIAQIVIQSLCDMLLSCKLDPLK